ncbi:MAG: HlyD family type I secretion periplasmic adaptor subunit [Campylobacterota bacterium]|nr:HlyD family type I secretion periplasmic adaptor subunit [Campylobacterota bacterium]
MAKKFSPADYAFMKSLSSAVLEKTPTRFRYILYVCILFVAGFIYWANIANVDEIVRGSGEVIPSAQNKVVQNLEGGIVKDILVKTGDNVTLGQTLLTINNTQSTSTLKSSKLKEDELFISILRLNAQAKGDKLSIDTSVEKKYPHLAQAQKSLYESNLLQLNSQKSILRSQIKQKQNELKQIKNRIRDLGSNLFLINKEIKMTAPMVERGIKSKVDFLQLKREKNSVVQEYNSNKNTLPIIQSSIEENRNKIKEIDLRFQNQSREKLNEFTVQLQRLQAQSSAISDQVDRTVVASPINGIVQTIFINTIGGVIKPGEPLVEIVPSDDTLSIEIKISPADIAFIYKGQNAKVQVSAYDFALFGSLDAKVTKISADSSANDKGERFYTVHLQASQNFLFKDYVRYKILPGMMVNAHIITGKKSIMDYILKPILKTKQYMFTQQ